MSAAGKQLGHERLRVMQDKTSMSTTAAQSHQHNDSLASLYAITLNPKPRVLTSNPVCCYLGPS